LEHPTTTSLLSIKRISKFFLFQHTQHPSWLQKCKSHHLIKSKGRLSFPSKTKSPSGATAGGTPQKMVPFFRKKPCFKYAKYDSTRASGEFTRGASSQREKMRKSEIAYASSRIRPFSLATSPTSSSWNRTLPAQIRPGEGKRDGTTQRTKQ
jgi:hypothetical protein